MSEATEVWYHYEVVGDDDGIFISVDTWDREDGYREGRYITGPVTPEHVAAAHAERYPPTDVSTP